MRFYSVRKARMYALLVIVLMLAVAGVGHGQRVQFLGFAGGPPGGSFFPAAAAIATYLGDNMTGINLTVESSGGSGENIRLVNSGETEMGIAFAPDLHAGYFGQEDFQGTPQTNLRSIGLVFWGYGHLVTLPGSGIESVWDLEGKRLAIGGTGTGSALTGERFFGHLGLMDKMRVSYLGGNAASTALKDGQVDVYNWHTGAPNAATLDTVSTHQIVMIDLATPAVESGFIEAYPFYAVGDIPPGTYDGVDVPVPTVLTGTYWFVHKDMSDDMVYEMVKKSYSDVGYAHMKNTFEPMRDMTPEQALVGVTVPLHPGAQRYWEEMGLEISEAIRAR